MGSGLNHLSPDTAARVPQALRASEQALANQDVGFFLQGFPAGARARLLSLSPERLRYLDIETSGLQRDATITSVAIYDGRQVSVYQGHNLPAFRHEWENAYDTLWVTFNGSRFDVPRLERMTGQPMRGQHLDMLPELKALGHTGSLDACARRLKVAVQRETEMNGEAAAQLWKLSPDNDQAMAALARYNAEDVLVLERLLVAASNLSMSEFPLFRPLVNPAQPSVFRRLS